MTPDGVFQVVPSKARPWPRAECWNKAPALTLTKPPSSDARVDHFWLEILVKFQLETILSEPNYNENNIPNKKMNNFPTKCCHKLKLSAKESRHWRSLITFLLFAHCCLPTSRWKKNMLRLRRETCRSCEMDRLPPRFASAVAVVSMATAQSRRRDGAVCVEGVGGGGRVWLWTVVLVKGSCSKVSLPFSPPRTSRLPFTLFFFCV